MEAMAMSNSDANLPKSLTDLRDELAEKYARKLTKDRSVFDGNDERIALVAFRAGFDAAVTTLTERVFFEAERVRDEAKQYALRVYGDALSEQQAVDDYFRGRYAQFEQDAARIGLAERNFSSAKAWIKELEARIEEREQELGEWQSGEQLKIIATLEARLSSSATEQENVSLKAQVSDMSARLAESERKYRGLLTVEADMQIEQLKDKLAAAETIILRNMGATLDEVMSWEHE
jgi:hypothetical protein